MIESALDTLCETALDTIQAASEVDLELATLSEAFEEAQDPRKKAALGARHDARLEEIEAAVLRALKLSQEAFDRWMMGHLKNHENWTPATLAELQKRQQRARLASPEGMRTLN